MDKGAAESGLVTLMAILVGVGVLALAGLLMAAVLV